MGFVVMYRYSADQFVPIALSEAWDFFSNPENLSKLTPDNIGFEPVTKSQDTSMYPGFFVTYKVAPLLGIKMTWATEITQVSPLKYFVDEQRLGPYKIWHHEHHFKEVEGGTLITDIIHYALPGGFIGRWFHPILVQPKLKEIFKFRAERVKELFG